MGSEAERARGLTDGELIAELMRKDAALGAEVAHRLQRLRQENTEMWHTIHPEEMGR